MIYKTLSVKQPWSYLQCAKIKDIENRTWKLPEKYKNEWVLIHASAEKTDNLDMVMFGFKKIYNWVVSEAVLFDKPILNVKGRLSFWDFDLPEEYSKLLK